MVRLKKICAGSSVGIDGGRLYGFSSLETLSSSYLLLRCAGGVLGSRCIYGYVGFMLLFDGRLVVEVAVWVFYFLFYFVICFDL